MRARWKIPKSIILRKARRVIRKKVALFRGKVEGNEEWKNLWSDVPKSRIVWKENGRVTRRCHVTRELVVLPEKKVQIGIQQRLCCEKMSEHLKKTQVMFQKKKLGLQKNFILLWPKKKKKEGPLKQTVVVLWEKAIVLEKSLPSNKQKQFQMENEWEKKKKMNWAVRFFHFRWRSCHRGRKPSCSSSFSRTGTKPKLEIAALKKKTNTGCCCFLF